MGCCLWVQSLKKILAFPLSYCVQYRVIYDSCISNVYNIWDALYMSYDAPTREIIIWIYILKMISDELIWTYVEQYFNVFEPHFIAMDEIMFFSRGIAHTRLAKRCEKALPWWRHQMETFSALLTLSAGEFTGHRWIPLTKASGAELWCFLWSVLK